jgi:hypothetical protein
MEKWYKVYFECFETEDSSDGCISSKSVPAQDQFEAAAKVASYLDDCGEIYHLDPYNDVEQVG